MIASIYDIFLPMFDQIKRLITLNKSTTRGLGKFKNPSTFYFYIEQGANYV